MAHDGSRLQSTSSGSSAVPGADDDELTASTGGAEHEGSESKRSECRGSESLRTVPDAHKPAILQEKNLMQLLADAITYRSSLRDIDIVLNCGAKVNAPVNRGLRPLHYAVYVDYVECVCLLIDRGADVNATDDIGYTPIHLCARKGNIESMKILIENGATTDFLSDDDGVEENSKALGYLTIEPINLAIENNHVDCLRLLLDHGARPDHRYFMGYEINLVPLEHLECMKILLEFGADPNVFNRCGVSPLMRACRQQNLPAARLLLQNGATVNLECPPRFDQKTALHFSITSGNAGLVHLLLRHRASLCRPTNYKYAALHTAVLADRPDLCDMLLKWGAEVNERSDECMTPLMLACATRGLSRQQELVQLLLEKGADVNAHSGFVTFTSPAYLSALVEHLRYMESDVSLPVMQLLVQYGARVHFTGAASTVRVLDAHGVLNYLSYAHHRPDLYSLLLHAAAAFDCDAIRTHRHLSTVQKIELLRLASTPPSLKHVVRLAIRNSLGSCLPAKVDTLPIPTLVKNFLMMV